MDNAIKPVLNESQISDIVSFVFGEKIKMVAVDELKDGFFNSAYAITMDNDKRYVLKLAPLSNEGFLRYEHNMMKTEVEVLTLLDQLQHVPVPKIYAYETSSPVYASSFFVMDYLDGDPYNKVKDSLPVTEREVIEEQLGEMTKHINSISGEKFGYYALQEQQGSSWSEVFMSMIRGIMLDARDAGVHLPAQPDEIVTAIERFIPSLNEVTVPSLVHWDLWEGNIFVKNGNIVGVIDCERALWGDPLMEYYFRSLINSPAHMKGYGCDPFTESQQQRIRLYDLYLALILHIECRYRGYSDQGYIDWTWSHLQEIWKGFINHSTRSL